MQDICDEPSLGTAGNDHYEAIILGAGITGLVSAAVLSEQGHKRILVVDQYYHVGGNHIDRSIGDYTFDVGSFIFQDDSPLLRHFPGLLEFYVPITPSWARLNPQGEVTKYPISIKDDILRAGVGGVTRILSSAIYARLFRHRMSNAKEFAQYWIGDYLLRRSGLESYMQRFYGCLPQDIDIELAKKRMLWISEHASAKNLIGRLFKRNAQCPINSQLARPQQGFQYLYQSVVEQLKGHDVTFRLGAPLTSLRKTGNTFELVTGAGTFTSERLISTVPIDIVLKLCAFPVTNNLETISLQSLFYSFAGKRGFDQSILYNFSHDGAWKRITVYSDFYGRVDGREYFTAEVIADDANLDVDHADKSFRRHVSANGLFEGDLKLEGNFILENAYPIYAKGSSRRAETAIKALRALGIESFGRQGGFNYQPTARVSTIEAEMALSPVH